MGDISNLDYNDFSAGQVAGDGMTIITTDTTVDELISWVFTAKALWFYDGNKYRIVVHFEALENSVVLYFFDDYGMISTQRYGGDS